MSGPPKKLDEDRANAAMEGAPPHRMRSIVAVNGIARDGVLTCECGWVLKYTSLVAALREHYKHAQAHAPVVN